MLWPSFTKNITRLSIASSGARGEEEGMDATHGERKAVHECGLLRGGLSPTRPPKPLATGAESGHPVPIGIDTF